MPRPTPAALCAQLGLALAPARVVEQIERAPELERIVAAVVAHGYAVAVDEPGPIRHLRRCDQVPRPDLGRIDSELRGQPVEQPLDDQDRFRAPGAAIRRARRLVGDHREALGAERGDLVLRGQVIDRVRRLVDREAVIGADVLHDAHVEPENAPVARRREPRVVRLLARLMRARDELGAGLDPLHGPAEADCEQRDEHVLRVDAFLRAEPAAGVGRDDAHALDRQADARGDGAAQVIGRLVRCPDGQALRRGVVLGAEPARLDRHRTHAPVGRVILDDHAASANARSTSPITLLTRPTILLAPACTSGDPALIAASASTTAVSGSYSTRTSSGCVGRHVRIGADDRCDRLADVAHLAPRQRVLRAGCVQADVRVRAIGARGGQAAPRPREDRRP